MSPSSATSDSPAPSAPNGTGGREVSRNAGAPVDRRVRRTRRRLKEALFHLLRERPWEEITVQGIVDRADVGRSTFYAHYESKEDLLFADFDTHLRRLAERASPSREESEDARTFRFSLPILTHIQEEAAFFRVTLLGGSDPRLREVTEGLLTDLLVLEFARLDPEGPERTGEALGVDPSSVRSGRARAAAGAFLALADWWLRAAPHLTPAEVDGLFQGAARVWMEAAG